MFIKDWMKKDLITVEYSDWMLFIWWGSIKLEDFLYLEGGS